MMKYWIITWRRERREARVPKGHVAAIEGHVAAIEITS
jgi:hypothetical protein